MIDVPWISVIQSESTEVAASHRARSVLTSAAEEVLVLRSVPGRQRTDRAPYVVVAHGSFAPNQPHSIYRSVEQSPRVDGQAPLVGCFFFQVSERDWDRCRQLWRRLQPILDEIPGFAGRRLYRSLRARASYYYVCLSRWADEASFGFCYAALLDLNPLLFHGGLYRPSHARTPAGSTAAPP